MKWVLLALLVINLGFGGYQYWLMGQSKEEERSENTVTFNNLKPSAAQLAGLDKVNAKTPVVQKIENRCVRIDGLNKGDGLEVVESRLKALEVDVERLEENVVLRQDYQVIVGPYSSAELARNDLQALSTKGIDSYVITSGSYTNSLSLGVFSSNINATRKLTEVRAQGIEAKTVVKDHTGLAIALLIESDSASLINDETLSSVLSPFKNSKFSRYICN